MSINIFLLCLRRRFMNIPVLVSNLGLLEQLAYWKVSAPCSAAGYNLTMKKHRYVPADSHRAVDITSLYLLLWLRVHFFCCFSSKFFTSNGLLREVSEVDKMNDSLQSELQVSSRWRHRTGCFNLLLLLHTVVLCASYWAESLQGCGGEWTSGWNLAGSSVSS